MINQAKIIELPRIFDDRGNLSFLEGNSHIPFEINRTYWIYDVPGGEKRGSHAFKKLHEFIIALSGSFDVVIDNGKDKIKYSLNRSYYGLYIPNLVWRTFENFSTNSLCLVVASDFFNPDDYIHNYKVFLDFLNKDVY